MNPRKAYALRQIDSKVERQLLDGWPDRRTLRRRAQRKSYWRAMRLVSALEKR